MAAMRGTIRAKGGVIEAFAARGDHLSQALGNPRALAQNGAAQTDYRLSALSSALRRGFIRPVGERKGHWHFHASDW